MPMKGIPEMDEDQAPPSDIDLEAYIKEQNRMAGDQSSRDWEDSEVDEMKYNEYQQRRN